MGLMGAQKLDRQCLWTEEPGGSTLPCVLSKQPQGVHPNLGLFCVEMLGKQPCVGWRATSGKEPRQMALSARIPGGPSGLGGGSPGAIGSTLLGFRFLSCQMKERTSDSLACLKMKRGYGNQGNLSCEGPRNTYLGFCQNDLTLPLLPEAGTDGLYANETWLCGGHLPDVRRVGLGSGSDLYGGWQITGQ